MFRQFIKLGVGLTRFNSASGYKYLRHGGNQSVQLSRHFSSEMTSNWPEPIINFLKNEQISQPTAIQEKTLPIAMKNKDLVGVARTGSGKTLAFAIPAIMKILKENEFKENHSNSQDKLPTCLVLAPTRELASQIYDVFKKFSNLGIRSVVLVGGSSRSEQMRQLSYCDQDIYIATPGRLLDLMESNAVDLKSIKYLVLDEADRMLDMGFEPQIRRIIEQIPDNRQTLMWSATWPAEIQSLAYDFMKDFEFVAVDSEKLKANPNIKQLICFCPPRNKLNIMLNHLTRFKEEHNKPRVLIFVNQKRTADQLLIQLMRNKHRAIAMHGDRTQRQRDEALRLFKNKACDIMVATDVAARGLDINDITHVINYDFPNTIEDYIHRIGRTARHEKKGISLSFFTDDNANIAGKLIHVLKETNQEIPAELEEYARNQHRYSSMNTISPKRRTPRNDFYSRRGSHLRDTKPGREKYIRIFDEEEEEDELEEKDFHHQRRERKQNIFNDSY